MLLFRMDFQREPTSHEARVEVKGPDGRIARRCSEPARQSPTSSSSFLNSHGAPLARTRRTVVFAEAVVVQQEIQPGFPALVSRHPASLCTAPDEPSALLSHSFRAWALRTFPATPKKAGKEVFVANLLTQNRELTACLKSREELAASAASSIDAPQLFPPAETRSAAADQAELGRLRALLATADAERVLLFERA